MKQRRKKKRSTQSPATAMEVAMAKYFDPSNLNTLPPIGTREEILTRAWWALRAAGFNVEIARFISTLEGHIKPDVNGAGDQLTPERAVQIILEQNIRIGPISTLR